MDLAELFMDPERYDALAREHPDEIVSVEMTYTDLKWIKRLVNEARDRNRKERKNEDRRQST